MNLTVFSIIHLSPTMPVLSSWEDFEKAAERLYLQDPEKVIFSWD